MPRWRRHRRLRRRWRQGTNHVDHAGSTTDAFATGGAGGAATDAAEGGEGGHAEISAGSEGISYGEATGGAGGDASGSTFADAYGGDGGVAYVSSGGFGSTEAEYATARTHTRLWTVESVRLPRRLPSMASRTCLSRAGPVFAMVLRWAGRIQVFVNMVRNEKPSP